MTLLWIIFILALIPTLMVMMNLFFYRPPGPAGPGETDGVSILIPARNEAPGIQAAVRSALAASDGPLEVVVLDDGSSDGTADRVRELAEADGRVRLISGKALAEGWCGKQYACRQLAGVARHGWFLFLDADVRIAPGAVPRLIAEARRRRTDLLSGFPYQKTGTWGEKAVIPLIHLVLLGYLPLIGMRCSRRVAFAAGCGQLFLARREAYEEVGGHGVIRESMHDGVRLPKAFRTAGFRTDLVDLTGLANCRMYRGLGELFQGFAKNAHEGMGSAGAIVPWTVLLLGGHVLPFVLSLALLGDPRLPMALTAVGLTLGARVILATRFRQSWLGVALHPVGIILIVAIQWYALWRRIRGRPVGWKGRAPA
ncbi:MAG: glycosyltransferase family 2 protein [Xanthomonadales bacterium]|nr:glycosyltransferase family 2 protein [Xanthomonadales bacterium]